MASPPPSSPSLNFESEFGLYLAEALLGTSVVQRHIETLSSDVEATLSWRTAQQPLGGAGNCALLYDVSVVFAADDKASPPELAVTTRFGLLQQSNSTYTKCKLDPANLKLYFTNLGFDLSSTEAKVLACSFAASLHKPPKEAPTKVEESHLLLSLHNKDVMDTKQLRLELVKSRHVLDKPTLEMLYGLPDPAPPVMDEGSIEKLLQQWGKNRVEKAKREKQAATAPPPRVVPATVATPSGRLPRSRGRGPPKKKAKKLVYHTDHS